MTRRALVGWGLAALVGACALVVWGAGPTLSYEFGLVNTTPPYPNRFATHGRTTSSAMPSGDRIVIPSIGVDAPIIDGPDASALKRGVWRQPDTATPDGIGACVIAGHRIRTQFILLNKVRTGDPVIVYWHRKEYDYRVTEQFVVNATERQVVESAERGLTLYTCVPRWEGDRRTVVRTVPVVP